VNRASPTDTNHDRAARAVADALNARDKVLMAAHVRPDGDSLGSMVALCLALQSIGKTAAAYSPSEIPGKLLFIPRIELVKETLPDWTPDATAILDCGSPDRVETGFVPSGLCVNVDHHQTNDLFGDINYVDPSAAAVGEQIFAILGYLHADITPDIATCLYTAIASDTGSFRYPSTTARTFRIASELTAAGADPSFVSQRLFESKSREEMILISRVYSRLRFECEGRMTWSEIRWQDYIDVGGGQHEPEGLASDIRAVEGVELSILFHELEGGGIRAGFRGKGLVDCSAIATSFGGGGHRNAAGYCNQEAQYEAERQRIVERSVQTVEESIRSSAST
jgi:phosphoesterase RecJ-like protein